MKEFKKKLSSLINRYSLENGSNTPDFILAEYLVNCLKTYNKAVQTSRPNEFKTKIISLSKPKELDWTKTMKKSVSRTVKLTNILNSLKTIEDLDKLLTQQRTELFNDLIKIADSGEFEDMRRELNIYFKGKDE